MVETSARLRRSVRAVVSAGMVALAVLGGAATAAVSGDGLAPADTCTSYPFDSCD